MISKDPLASYNTKRTNKIKRVLFFVLFTLSLIQQMPIIKDTVYSEIRVGLYIIFAIFSILSLISIKFFLKNKFNLIFFSTVFCSFFISLISQLFAENKFNFSEILIPFIIFACSFNTDYTDKQKNKVLFFYIILSALLGLTSIFYYGEGIAITDQYFLGGKNQIGPMLGYSIFIVGFWLINDEGRNKKRSFLNYLLYTGIFVSILTSLLVIRNRASIVALFLTFLILIVKKAKFKFNAIEYFFIVIFTLSFIVFFLRGSVENIMEFVTKSLFSSYDVNDLNSLSAGRTGVYTDALSFVKRNFLLGELGTESFLSGIPHNYLLYKWVTLGVVLSLPLFLFYAYLWKIVGQIIFKKTTLTSLPIWILLFSLIISVFEYTFPYGPGVSQMIVWFLLGQYFRRLQISDIKI